MPTKTKHDHGTFSYAELATSDSAGAKTFYGGLFGWTFDDSPIGPDMIYSTCMIGKDIACAMYPKGKEMEGVPTHWGSYITVDDVDAMTKKVVANGGKVIKEAFDVMDFGRMSVAQDPTGASFMMWQAKKHIGATVVNEPGALTYNELYTTNVDAAGKFYCQTFGWTTEAMDMGPMGTYTLFKRPGEKSNAGGMMPMLPNMKGVPSNWLVYFLVADCDASTKKVGELGGKVMMPPMDIPNIGRFSVVMDPQGAAFALFKMGH